LKIEEGKPITLAEHVVNRVALVQLDIQYMADSSDKEPEPVLEVSPKEW